MITWALHDAAAVVKFALICNCVALNEVGVLSYVPPLVKSRNRTIQPDTKFAPLTVNACELLEPGTGFGETLLIEGTTTGAVTVKFNWPEA